MQDDKMNLRKVLKRWVDDAGHNGITQHSEAWHQDRKTTVGGSAIASLQSGGGVDKLIKQKIGVDKFDGNIMTRWGNTFEHVAKTYVEQQLNCEVLGEDLYVRGGPGVAYSPDGLAVIVSEEGVPEIVLLEFKCPYSRVPTSTPPKQYVPQVKMGLEVINIASRGLLVEANFKRRTLNTDFTSRQGQFDNGILAHGLVGFYYPIDQVGPLTNISALYQRAYATLGVPANDFKSNDLSTALDQLLNEIMKSYVNDHKLRVWHSKLYMHGEIVDPCALGAVASPSFETGVVSYSAETMSVDEQQLLAYSEFCKNNAKINLGVLPWKLIDVRYHNIDKTIGYLTPYLSAIQQVVDVATRYNDALTPEQKHAIYPTQITADVASTQPQSSGRDRVVSSPYRVFNNSTTT